MKVIRFILLLSIIPLVFSSCKDDDPQYLGEFRLGPEGEAYIKFEPGSYWVYENDQTGERDSVVMDYYQSEMWHFKGLEREYYREHISFKWLGTSGVYTFTSLHPFVDLTPEDAFIRNTRHWSIPCNKQVTGRSAIMHMPPTFNSGGGVSGQVSKLRTTYDSLQVSGEWFYDVAVFELDRDWIWDSKPSKYYWAKNVGLIRKENFSHLTGEQLERWVLVKYQVTQ